MKFNKTLLLAACAGFLLSACGGKEAMEDLVKLKDQTCACAKDDEACREGAKKSAREWVEKHKNARGVDQAKMEQVLTEPSPAT